MSVNVNSDNRVADVMAEIKRHFKYCNKCPGAIKALDYDNLCRRMRVLIVTAALQFDTVIPRRLSAARNKRPVFYACPDIGAHSKTWAMTAEPLTATGIQESLF